MLVISGVKADIAAFYQHNFVNADKNRYVKKWSEPCGLDHFFIVFCSFKMAKNTRYRLKFIAIFCSKVDAFS